MSTEYQPVMVLDISGFSGLGSTRKRAVIDRTLELMKDGIEPLLSDRAVPQQAPRRWNVGDGYYVVFYGASPHEALMVADRICRSVAARHDPDVDHLIRFRIVLGFGTVRQVDEGDGHERFEGEVLIEVTRLLDGDKVRGALKSGGRATVLAATREFVEAWEHDGLRRVPENVVAGTWRQFTDTDKHGKVWQASFFISEGEEDQTGPDDERLQFAREDLTRVLGQSSTFRRFIAEQIDCTPKDFEAGPTLQEVVEAVLGLDPREICRLASEAKVVLGETKASGDKLTPAAVATELVCITLPALIGVEDVERVRGHVGSPDDPLVENVASLSTVAEIIMAGADLGKAAFVPSSNPRGFPRGRYSIPPPPEAGRSAPGETAYRDLLAALADQLEATADIALEAEFTRYLEGRFGDPETVEFLQTEKFIHEHIRDELVEDQKKNRRTFYVVVVLPTDEGRRQRRLKEVSRLKQNFPEIMFLSLERDDRKRLDQTRTYGPLRSIFPGPTVEQEG